MLLLDHGKNKGGVVQFEYLLCINIEGEINNLSDALYSTHYLIIIIIQVPYSRQLIVLFGVI